MSDSSKIGSHNQVSQNLYLQMKDGELSTKEANTSTNLAGVRADTRTDPWARHSALKTDLKSARAFMKNYVQQNKDRIMDSGDERRAYRSNVQHLKHVVEQLSEATKNAEVGTFEGVLGGVRGGLQVIREDYNDDWALGQVKAAGSSVASTAQSAGAAVADTASNAVDAADAAIGQGLNYASSWWNS